MLALLALSLITFAVLSAGATVLLVAACVVHGRS